MNARKDAYVGAGSNIDAEKNLRLACDELARIFGPLSASSVYRSPAVGFDGPDFLNMVILFSTDCGWAEVNGELSSIETLAGRAPGDRGFASRPLDLDLLMFGDQVIDDPAISLPRADITEYAHVLLPLSELAPDLEHPVEHLKMRELWDQFDDTDQPVERLGDAYQPILRPPSTAMT